MEQIIGIIIILIFWAVASFIKKIGKQNTAQKAKPVNATGTDNADNSGNILQNNDLENLIKMFTGLDTEKQTIQKPTYNYVENDKKDLKDPFGDVDKPSIATEELLSTIKNTDSINHSILANDNKIAENQNFQKNIPTAEKSVGRKKYDFNLKKAVVYSIILEKRFDF
ncbi:MAG: hypothetical protein GX259_01785 [Bacteroidales bacterium]|nr:hypothetical protein [Bacteroidales bacterium]